MAKVHQLKKGLYTVTALTLSFGPFVAASGESGIFFGTITRGTPATFDPGTPATFTQATFDPGTPATFTPATFINATFTPGLLDPESDFFATLIPATFTQATFDPGTPATFTPATFDPGTPATFTQGTFDPGTPATFTPATFDPGTPATSTPATFTDATVTQGEPVGLVSVTPPVHTLIQARIDPQATFDPGTPATFTQATFDPGIPATFIPGSQGTSLNDLPPGQRFALENIGQLCAQDNSIACSLSAGIDGITAQNLSPQAGIQAETIAITSPYQFIRSVNDGMQRLMADRASANERSQYSQTQQSSFLMRSSASIAGTPSFSTYGFIGPLGVSLSGGGSFGDRNNAEGQTGFQLNTRQASLIIDYSFNQKLIGGFSFDYLGADRNLKLASGNLNSDSYRFAPFLLFRPTANSYLNVMGGYALVNYHSIRSVVSSSGITFDNAAAKYDADQFFASVGGGYTFTFMDGWNLRGYGRGDYSHIDVKSYQEKGGLATDGTNNLSLAMQVGGQNVRSVTSTLGAELSHAISTKAFVPVIIPRMRAEWVHEFENDSRAIRAGFIDQNGFNTTAGLMGVAGPERNWANLGAGVQLLFARGVIGYINYDRLIIQHANNNIISGGVRITF